MLGPAGRLERRCMRVVGCVGFGTTVRAVVAGVGLVAAASACADEPRSNDARGAERAAPRTSMAAHIVGSPVAAATLSKAEIGHSGLGHSGRSNSAFSSLAPVILAPANPALANASVTNVAPSSSMASSSALAAAVPQTAERALDLAAAKADRARPDFNDPKQALRAGLERYQAGDAPQSVAPLTYAAQSGAALARWKLGKMYAAGDGVSADDHKAYVYFSQIVDQFDEETTPRREYSMVASAFVAVGVYCLNGIPKTEVRPDPRRALAMFQYAAVNFGDAAAQYNLARLYLDGAGVEKDSLQAARWLRLAAEKGHPPSQALLGHLLFNGDGVGRRRAQGLMYLTLARESAAEAAKDRWIVDLYEKAIASASDTDRKTALANLETYLRKR